MAGLVPAIHAFFRHALQRRDGRHKAGHDEIKRSTTSAANLILPGAIRTADRRGRAACDVDLATPRSRHVRACRLIERDADPKGR
jgi:hypothetical protein